MERERERDNKRGVCEGAEGGELLAALAAVFALQIIRALRDSRVVVRVIIRDIRVITWLLRRLRHCGASAVQ